MLGNNVSSEIYRNQKHEAAGRAAVIVETLGTRNLPSKVSNMSNIS
jgi:hypothetical protein